MDILERLDGIIADTKDFTMLELGACDGYHTKQFLDKLVASNRPFVFHAFEPEEANHRTVVSVVWSVFQGGFQASGRPREAIQVHKKAIGADCGVKDFYVSGGYRRDASGNVLDHYYGSSSIREPKNALTAWPDMTFTKSTVEVVSLDSIFANTPIDFIWADIQGAEVDMIRGGIDTLKNTRYLYTEYCDGELYEGEIGLKEICTRLHYFDVVEDFGGDVLLKNRMIT